MRNISQRVPNIIDIWHNLSDEEKEERAYCEIVNEVAGNMAMEYQPASTEWIDIAQWEYGGDVDLLIWHSGNNSPTNDKISQSYIELLDAILYGDFDDTPINIHLIKEFHYRIAESALSKDAGGAGEWRTTQVHVGNHTPPPPWQLDMIMRERLDHLNGLIETAGSDWRLQINALAYTECAFLNTHPFVDFNGRTIRTLCWFLALRVLDIPVKKTWVEPGTRQFATYIKSLHEFDDSQNYSSMAEFWLSHRIRLPG